MRVVCQQPHYLPWLGYFELFARADTFVFLDDVQWTRQGRQHRTRLLDHKENRFWLTVPIQGHSHRSKTIRDMKIDSCSNWAKKHWQSVQSCYGSQPYFKTQLEPLLKPVWEEASKKEFLLDVCQDFIWALWEPLQLKCQVEWSSDYKIETTKNQRLIDICQRLGADEYYSTLGSTRYLDLSQFRQAGLTVRWQHFRPRQLDIKKTTDVSILDGLANQDLSQLRSQIASDKKFSVADCGLRIATNR